MTTAAIDLPDVSQPFEWERDTRTGLFIKRGFAGAKPHVLLLAYANGEGVSLAIPTDPSRKLAAYIWAAAAEADARAEQ